MANYTPPPWSYHLDSEGYYAITHESPEHEPGDIAHVYVPGAVDPEYDDGNEGLANTRIMTAAPLLLDALKAYQKYNDHDQDEDYDGCDGDCEAAVALWLEAERLSRAALAAVEPPAEAAHA